MKRASGPMSEQDALRRRATSSTTVNTMGNRLLLGLCLVAILAGCQNTHTPFDGRRPQEADDPMLTTQEQRVRARSFYAYPDEVGNLPGQSTYREYYYR